MKKQTGIWIDGSKAVIVNLIDGKERVEEIEAEVENRVHHFADGNQGVYMGGKHLVPEKRFEERERHQMNQYLDTVLKKVADADELFVFGPAETRKHLQHKLDTEKAFTALAGKLRGVEPADHMTQNQVVAKVKKFFL